MKPTDPSKPCRDAERLRRLVWRVLFGSAAALSDSERTREHKSVAMVMARALARSCMDGDLKAIALMMELAGTDYRSRDSQEKHLLDREKLNPLANLPPVIFEETRPE